MDAVAANDRILIFIPCYNCSKQVGRVIARIARLPAGICDEVLVVDNLSADNTIEVAQQALSQVDNIAWRVVRNRENYNLGGSHKVAFNYAIDHGFTHVIVLHGDDQADIADIVAPMQSGMHRSYDSLLGARFMRGSRREGYSLYRTAGNYGLNAICGVLSRSWIADQGSGLNMYSTAYLASRFYRNFDNALTFPNMMFLYGVAAKSKYRFIPISWREEDQVSNAKAFRQAFRVIKLCLRPAEILQLANGPSRDYQFETIHSGSPIHA